MLTIHPRINNPIYYAAFQYLRGKKRETAATPSDVARDLAIAQKTAYTALDILNARGLAFREWRRGADGKPRLFYWEDPRALPYVEAIFDFEMIERMKELK